MEHKTKDGVRTVSERIGTASTEAPLLKISQTSPLMWTDSTQIVIISKETAELLLPELKKLIEAK